MFMYLWPVLGDPDLFDCIACSKLLKYFWSSLIVVSGVRRNDCKQELHEGMNLNNDDDEHVDEHDHGDDDDDDDDDTVEPLPNGHLGDRGKWPCGEVLVMGR